MKKPRPFKITVNGLTQFLHCDKVDDKEFDRLARWIHISATWRAEQYLKTFKKKAKKK